MKILPFKGSSVVSLGIELEIQIVNPRTFGLVSRAKDLMRNIKGNRFEKNIKPEITQSMIEINSSIHQSPKNLLGELIEIHAYLVQQANELDLLFSGGGTHPFQKWSLQKIFPSIRFKNLSKHYRYLSQQSTVFGQHIHVGCGSGEDALYLTHALARYIPQLIAMSASSPFFQGVDTGYHSTRSNVFNAFPTSGVIPYLTTWEEFSDYFYKMHDYELISTMKDFYWDVRPKPEFGTVELRVCDTPLTIQKAVAVAAYAQALALYILEERPVKLSHDHYYLYNHNRFQASRYGLEGSIIDPQTGQSHLIYEDILDTIKKMDKQANFLNNMGFISQLAQDVIEKRNDVTLLRQILKHEGSFQKVVSQQCDIWKKV